MFSSYLIFLTLLSSALSQSCPPEGYFSTFADSQNCDRYVQCVSGEASEKLCPDGLVFDEKLAEYQFPCSYPTEVDCGSRTGLQQPQPTQNCPNAWGYFSSGDSSVCDLYYNCVDGREFRFSCPEGLAFSSQTYRCEWPENSPDCDVEAFLGFTCPQGRDLAQELAVGTPRYASPRDCRRYFLCHDGVARLHVCQLGLVFNRDIYNCDEPENVSGCESYYPADELAEIRAQKERRQRLSEEREREFQERFAQLNSQSRF